VKEAAMIWNLNAAEPNLEKKVEDSNRMRAWLSTSSSFSWYSRSPLNTFKVVRIEEINPAIGDLKRDVNCEEDIIEKSLIEKSLIEKRSEYEIIE
jgi:hypothetical protein